MSSKIFKAGYVNPSNEAKIIEAKPISFKNIAESNESNENNEDEEAQKNQIVKIPKEIQEIIDEAKREADEILQSAHLQVLELKEKAEQELQETRKEMEEQSSLLYESSKEEGYSSGHLEGYSVGEKQAHIDYQQRISDVNQILKDATNHKIEELMEAQNLIVNLSFEIASKIVLNNPDVLKDQIVDLVAKSLEKVRDTEKVEINVNPSDFKIVNEALSLFKNMIAGKAEIVIQMESHIDVGSCLLHTSKGTIDAKVTTQLEEIRKVLQNLDLGREGLAEA